MSVSYPTKLYLAFKSGNKCAFENCRKSLTMEGKESNPAVLGEAAHIYGEHDKAARYRKGMTDEERNHCGNLIYLCPTCHTKIDKQEEDYPADFLLKLKKKHEAWILEQLDEGMSEFSFAELEIAVKAIASGKHYSNSGFQAIPPEEKIQKNRLTDVSRSQIKMGLSRSAEVRKFLVEMSRLDNHYPERLKDGFKQKYLELKKTMSGDLLFIGMLEHAQRGQYEFKLQAASLAILSYLFLICEVFEK